MPKVINTRKQRARDLYCKIVAGPSLAMPGQRLSQEEISKGYDLWFSSWIDKEIIDLIPELRNAYSRGDAL